METSRPPKLNGYRNIGFTGSVSPATKRKLDKWETGASVKCGDGKLDERWRTGCNRSRYWSFFSSSDTSSLEVSSSGGVSSYLRRKERGRSQLTHSKSDALDGVPHSHHTNSALKTNHCLQHSAKHHAGRFGSCSLLLMPQNIMYHLL